MRLVSAVMRIVVLVILSLTAHVSQNNSSFLINLPCVLQLLIRQRAVHVPMTGQISCHSTCAYIDKAIPL